MPATRTFTPITAARRGAAAAFALLLPLLALAGAAVAQAHAPAQASAADGSRPAPQAPGARRAAPSSDRLILLVRSAVDCPACKLWRDSAEGLAVARQLPHQWPRLQLVQIERSSLHGPETEALYPAHLRHLYHARRERHQLSPPVPLFEIVRDGQVIARQSGMQGWTQSILPALQQLAETRPGPTGSTRR